jgi:hypothetical protein
MFQIPIEIQNVKSNSIRFLIKFFVAEMSIFDKTFDFSQQTTPTDKK